MALDARVTLIADVDVPFLESIRKHPLSKRVPVHTAASGKEAMNLLNRKDLNYCGIFISPRVAVPQVEAVFLAARSTQASVPLFALLAEDGDSLSDTQTSSYGVVGQIRKPVDYGDLVGRVRPDLVEFNTKAVVTDGKPVGASVETSGEEFVPVSATDYLAGSVSHFDIYVGLAKGRFVKILRGGESFDHERVQSYLSKGVSTFYILRSDQERFLQYTGTVSTRLVEKQAPSAIAMSQTLNHGEQIVRFLLSQKAGSAQLEYSKRFTENVASLAPRLARTAGSQEFTDILDKLVKHDHSAAVCMMAALLGRELKFESETAVHQLGVACLLHDVSVLRNHPNLDHEDLPRMTPDEVIQYKDHPRVAGVYLRSLGSIPEGVIQAVEQHHERRDGSGFPRGISGGALNRVAEIIGLSEEVVRAYERERKQAGTMERLEFDMARQFSGPVVAAYQKVFGKRKK